MAITESDYLHIHKDGVTYLLLRSPTHFHLIRVDAHLTESRMERLLRIYPCDTNQLSELGVHFSAFKAENLRGIVVKGYQTGDTLELWIGSDVKPFQLGSDYSEEVFCSFFSGFSITQQMPPKWGGLDPNIIRKITWSLNGISIICAVLFFFIGTPYKLWSALCVLCQLSALILALLYPTSFTLADDSRNSNLYTNKRKGHLLPTLISTGLALSLRIGTDFTYSNTAFWIFLCASIAIALVLCAVYIWRNRALQNSLANTIGTVVFIALLGFGTVGQLNYLLDFTPVNHCMTEAVDKRVSSGVRSTSYYCTVLQPNGEPLELNLTAREYNALEIGDDILVTYHNGAFGIPFSMVDTSPDHHK